MRCTRLYIHIGGEKTGSTSLQAFLHSNAARLKENGICYPNGGRRAYFEASAHFPLAASLLPNDDPREFVSLQKRQSLDQAAGQLVEDLSRSSAPAVVISCEHFASRVRDAARLASFRDRLRQASGDVKIVCYVRDQVSLALSSYSSGVRFGRRKPFDLDEVRPENPYFNPLTTLDLWASVFGHENIIAREYEAQALTNGDICEDFCSVLGISSSGYERPPRLNTSLDAVAVEALRQLNHAMTMAEEDVARFQADNALRAAIILPRIEGMPSRPLTLSIAGSTLILDRFRSANEELNRQYMKGSLSRGWFECKHGVQQDSGPCTQDPPSSAEVTKALHELVLRLAADLQASRLDQNTSRLRKLVLNWRDRLLR